MKSRLQVCRGTSSEDGQIICTISGCAFVGFTWGFLLFLAIGTALELGLGPMWTQSAVVSQIVLKSALIVVAIAAWKLLNKTYREMGWQRADWWNRSHVAWFGLAAVAMMAASVVMIFLERQHPVAGR